MAKKSKKNFRLQPEELAYIRENSFTKTDEDIARDLSRNLKTVIAGRKKLGIVKKGAGSLRVVDLHAEHPIQVGSKLNEDQRKEFFKTQLANSVYYKLLKQQFTVAEIDFYLEEWASLCIQFEDVIATEKRQIDEFIKAEIMANRIAKNIKIAEDEIFKLQKEAERLYKKRDMPNDPEAQERDQVLQELSSMMSRSAGSMRSDYQANVKLRNDILEQLNARRADRVTELKKAGTTFLGLVSAFKDKTLREAHGRQMELVRLSKERKKNEFRRVEKFVDGSNDCVLIDDQSEIPQQDIVYLADMECQFLKQYEELEGKNILIIDDDIRRVQFFQDKFAKNKLFYSTNAEHAISQLETLGFDLICLDYDLGMGSKGLEIAQYIILKDIRAEVLVHSMNENGATLIKEALVMKGNIEIFPFEKMVDKSKEQNNG